MKFTADASRQAKSDLQTAADTISPGPGRNANPDCRHYAQIGVAQKRVEIASGSFRLGQPRWSVRQMRDYASELTEMQNKLLRNGSASNMADCYSPAHVLTRDEADMLNSSRTEPPRITGRFCHTSHAGGHGGYVQIATNQGTITRVASLFADADLRTLSGLASALNSCSSLVKPAYLAQSISPSDIARVLANDRAVLSAGLNSILAAGRRHAVVGI